MCGIAGWVPLSPHAKAAPDSHGRAERSADCLLRRGPDARWVGQHGASLLVSTRLAIVDRSPASNPPILDPSGQVCLLYNGELYEAAALRQELATRGQRFRTEGDGEVVLAAYLEYGPKFLYELDGMFALAIVDRRHEREEGTPRLLLARDRFGEKPLLMARVGDAIVFGSTAASLAPWLPSLEEDGDALATVVRHGFLPRGETCLRGVHRVRPGTALCISKGAASVLPFAERRVERLDGLPLDELAKRFWNVLRQGVRRRAQSHVGLGLFLSGGLDSAAIALALADEGIGAKAFTAGFAEGADEREWAQQTAKAAGLPWQPVELGADLLEEWIPLTQQIGEPLADASALNLYALARLARQEVGVVLTGEGGDELFGGYRRERVFSAMRDLPVPGAVAAALRRLPGEAGRVGAALSRAPGAGRYQELRDRVLEAEELLCPEFRRGDRPSEEGLPRAAEELREAAALARESDLYAYLPNDLLFRLDAAAMAASLEPRAPFLDPDVADFGSSLPPAARQGWTQGKRVVRRALRGRAPAAVVDGRKRGFGPPLARWFRETGFLSTILLESGACAPPLDRAAVERLVREHRSGARDHSVILARAVAVEIFRRVLPEIGSGAL
ncbi:MAG: asparagine synthase (glutamine-hydrolyzing) [Planctomycetes bacterium]|nr:asparagine synthase (glutamine-hydrolyzing) [Planctomycetota bacterium]